MMSHSLSFVSRRAVRLPGRGLLLPILALGVLLSGLAPEQAHAADPEKLFPAPIYVTLQSSDAVETLPKGILHGHLPGAHYDAASADGRWLLVSSKDRPEVYLLDAHDGRKLATFMAGPTPQGVAISPNGRLGLAVSAGDGTVTVIDLPARKVIKTLAVGKTPHNARFTADGKRAYVTLQGGGGVAVLDMRTLKLRGTFPVPGITGPHNLDLSADGKTLWIRDLVGKVAVVDLATRKVRAIIPVSVGHAGIDVVPGGKYVFTGGIADHLVDVIDAHTFKVVKRIPVGQAPHGVRASRDGHQVYVGVAGEDILAVIDTRTLQVVKRIHLDGRVPFWLAVAGNP